MSKKRILMLAPYFVPDTSSGIHRSLGLANYLVGQNWDVDVVTIAESDIMLPDYGLFSKMNKGIRIHRFPAIDLIKNITSFFGKSLRLTQREDKVLLEKQEIDQRKNYFQVTSRVMNWLWPLYLPDKKLQWAISLINKGFVRRLAEKADCVYSSGPPQSVHVAAAILKYLTKRPWVADLRDPWSNNPLRVIQGSVLVKKYDRFLEKQVLSKADHVVCNTPVMARELIERHGDFDRNITYVLNGYDSSIFSEDGYIDYVDHKRIKVVHAGTLYGQRDISFLLQALKALNCEHPDITKDFHFEFIGFGAENYRNLVDKLKLGEIVSLNNPIPFEQAIEQDRQATICLCLGLSKANNHSQIPAKLYNFIGMGKPILALASKKGAIASVLENAGVDYFLADPGNPVEIQSCLKELHNRWKNGRLFYGGNKEKRICFDRQKMSEKLEKLFLEVISKREY